MDTLALCIPAYNASKVLPRLLTSSTSQLIPFNEIFVYDDCSTDNTREVAESFGATVIKGDVNRGCSFGKNALAEIASSDWIHFHDADDDLLPDFTQKVFTWIATNGPQCDVLLLNFNYVDFKTGELLGTAAHDRDEIHRDALKYSINHKIVNFGVYKRRSLLAAGGFDLDPKVLYNEDNAFHQRLAKKGLKFDYLSDITCINYRYNKSMSASNQLKCTIANYHVLANIAATHGDIYAFEIATQLWTCIAGLGAAQDWHYVRMALLLSRKLGYRSAPASNKVFTILTELNPFTAIWLREKLIRLFKPSLRK